MWDQVLTGLDMAQLLDPADPEVDQVIKSTREILERLEAKPYLARLDAATASADRANTKTEIAAAASLEVAASSLLISRKPYPKFTLDRAQSFPLS